ncbi:MAG: hypothetical protein QNK37_18775 [Acidobacteriota bacterium]|nr:hypothetical protein [Acidobacteriota bacterium]
MTGKQGERRRYIRFSPDADSNDLQEKSDEFIAHVDLDTEGDFHPTLVGYLIQKSHAGCCLVMARNDESTAKLERDFECLIKAGPLHPLRAVVRWRRDLDEEILKAGFQFIE